MAENTCDKISESPEVDQAIHFTGIVVTYNEEQHLRECLSSLAFCEQLLVIDLGSEDGSIEIAKQCEARVIHHEWAPIVEQVWPDAISLARHPWIIRSDPDEVFPAPLIDDLMDVIAKPESVGAIEVPRRYYFRGRPLSTTIWGNVKYAAKVFHRDRVKMEPYVHRGVKCREGYRSERVEETGDNAIRHYWADSFAQLFEKHQRYIKHEGKARYDSGQRFSWHRMLVNVLRQLKANLINYHGLCGGFNGVFLSLFYGWYILKSWLSLREYERYQ